MNEQQFEIDPENLDRSAAEHAASPTVESLDSGEWRKDFIRSQVPRIAWGVLKKARTSRS